MSALLFDAPQLQFQFETGRRSVGKVYIYAYICKGKVVYIGQAVDVVKRDHGHKTGDLLFDEYYRTHKKDFTPAPKLLDTVDDERGGPVANARENELIDFYQTWVELGKGGFNVRPPKTYKKLFFELLKSPAACNSFSSIDEPDGDGAYAVVRECRRLHRKGDHRNWYRHRVYKLHNTLEDARVEALEACYPLSKRSTETSVDCRLEHHRIVHVYQDGTTWKNREFSIWEQEQ